MDSHRDANEAVFGDPTRRTYLAQERTLLAWWRTALATVGLAIAIGSILPKLTDLPKGPFIGLGAGYAALSIWFVLLGAYRQRTNEPALAERRYLGLRPGMVTVLTVYMTALMLATCWVLFWGPG
jgi:putative membrane protein